MGRNPLDRIPGRVPPIKPKIKNIINGINIHSRRARRLANKVRYSLERVPEKDIFTPQTDPAKVGTVPATKPAKVTHPKETTKPIDRTNKIGIMFVEKNKMKAKSFVNDLEIMGQALPEVTFIPEFNTGSAKELSSILDKITNRSEQFKKHGYSAVVRDDKRGMVFMLDADQNYQKIIDFMTTKRRYKVAKMPQLDKDGNIVKGPNGKPIMVPDIEVSYGKNAIPSGHQQVQIRFEKGGELFELLIMPGANSATFYRKEHSVYEQFRLYKARGITQDEGAKEIVSAIKKVFNSVTKPLYASALAKDTYGAKAATEPVTFSKEKINTINGLFKSLKDLFRGQYEALPPSKRYSSDFKETKKFKILDAIEKELQKFMDLYKPIEKD